MHGGEIRLDLGYRVWRGDPNKDDSWRPVSCFQSIGLNTIALLQAIKQFTSDEEFLVLQDDCVFIPNFMEEYEKSYAMLPNDWQMVYLTDKYHFRPETCRINERVCRGIPMCSHSILLKRSIIDEIADILRCGASACQHDDVALVLETRRRNLPVYTFSPGLTSQHTIDEVQKKQQDEAYSVDPNWISSLHSTTDRLGCHENEWRQLIAKLQAYEILKRVDPAKLVGELTEELRQEVAANRSKFFSE